MSARPRLLFLTQTLPFPPDTGVAVRTFNVLRLLAQEYEITCLAFYRRRAHGSAAERDAAVNTLRKLAGVQVFPIPQEHSRSRLIGDHLRSLARRRAYTRYVYDSRRFRAALDAALDSMRFDLVHVDSLDLCGYLPQLRDAPVVCVHHNVESDLLTRRACLERNAMRRRYIQHQARLLEREESTWCERVALNVMVSEADCRILQARAPRAAFTIVPNGVDTDEFQPHASAGSSVAYLGGTEWFPNSDALDFFCNEILPYLRNGGEAPQVRWVGRSTPDEQRRYLEEFGVELTGYVPDVRPYIRDAACTIVPLRVGGGTRLKITTAWGLGKAVVSTGVGCEGLAAVDGENILIRDTPVEFAAAIRAVITDRALRRRLEQGARSTAERLYSWDVVAKPMLASYDALLS